MTDSNSADQFASGRKRLEKMKPLKDCVASFTGGDWYQLAFFILYPSGILLFFFWLIPGRITPNTTLSVFLPFIVVFILYLFVQRKRLRNTIRSETGFCPFCEHEIPPGEQPKNCQECGRGLTEGQNTKIRVQETPALYWSNQLVVIVTAIAVLTAPWSLSSDDGIFGTFRSMGFDPYAYYSTSGLVSAAESDLRGRSEVWTKLQGQTLTPDQLDRLANTVIAYNEDRELVFSFRSGAAAIWLNAEIQKGTLSTPTLIRLFTSAKLDPNGRVAAFDALALKTLSAEEQANFFDAVFAELEDLEIWLGIDERKLAAWLDREALAGNLTPAQLERARDCNWMPKLRLPERIRVDEPVEIVLGMAFRERPSDTLLADWRTAIAIEGVAIDDGPFEDPGFESALARDIAFVRKNSTHSRSRSRFPSRNLFFPMEMVFSEPGPHVIRIRYVLFDGQRLTEPPSSVERAADGSLLLPDGAGWILERVFEHTVVVEGD